MFSGQINRVSNFSFFPHREKSVEWKSKMIFFCVFPQTGNKEVVKQRVDYLKLFWLLQIHFYWLKLFSFLFKKSVLSCSIFVLLFRHWLLKIILDNSWNIFDISDQNSRKRRDIFSSIQLCDPMMWPQWIKHFETLIIFNKNKFGYNYVRTKNARSVKCSSFFIMTCVI